ncbi:MAG: ribose-phosphate diphosphokinase [Sulfolobales archaeon]
MEKRDLRDLGIISLPGDPGYGSRFKELFNSRLYSVHQRIFPDGETYIRLIDELQDEKKLLIIQSMFPEQDRRFFEILQILDILDSYDKDIYLLILYMAYARQDKVFLRGEPVSARVVIRHITQNSKVKKIYVAEPHSDYVSKEFDRVHAINLIRIMGETLREKWILRRPIIVSPDQGGAERAKTLSEIFDTEYLVFRKYRDRYTGSIKTEAPENIDSVRERETIIVDDILSTGGTIAEVASILRRSGSEKIYVLCAHCLFVSDALNRVLSSGIDKIFCGNTVKRFIDDPHIEYIDLSSRVGLYLAEKLV